MPDTTRAELPRGIVPPGPYAGQSRSPVVWVYLCPVCAGYAPTTDPDYSGYLSGRCEGCGSQCREVHKIRALIDSADPCGCHSTHQRVTGDLDPTAAVREACARLAEQQAAAVTYPDPLSLNAARVACRRIAALLRCQDGDTHA